MSDEPDFNEINRTLVEEFRANNGKVTGMFEGWPVVVITTTGAKSGLERTNPLVYSKDGDDVVIIASKGGAPTSPDWYHNIVKTPRVKVELPGEVYQAEAVIAQGAERDRLYRQQADLMSNFDDYAAATTRVIPVVVLKRR